MAEILIVEDEDSVARFLRQAMEEAGHLVATCDNGKAGLETGEARSFDLILLDIMLPELDGIEVCRALREANVRTPVLMLTAKDTIEDKIRGLDAGADDYLVKPFVLKELLARVRALLRRGRFQGEEREEELTVGALVLHTGSMSIVVEGEEMSLSATEFALLEYLMRNQGKVLTREELLEHVWQFDFGGDSNVLHVYISYLRKKLASSGLPKLIHTVRGVGYRFQEG
jgi:DNA-binding response OmpR family regulator